MEVPLLPSPYKSTPPRQQDAVAEVRKQDNPANSVDEHVVELNTAVADARLVQSAQRLRELHNPGQAQPQGRLLDSATVGQAVIVGAHDESELRNKAPAFLSITTPWISARPSWQPERQQAILQARNAENALDERVGHTSGRQVEALDGNRLFVENCLVDDRENAAANETRKRLPTAGWLKCQFVGRNYGRSMLGADQGRASR